MTYSILMHRTNPNGHKLEELLTTIIAEIQAKTDELNESTAPVAPILQRNNAVIVELLSAAKSVQLGTMEELLKLGEDRGPSHPRI